jgi:murein DD-endopeptidase MepM/ murein hydrolase activator NlpD
VASRAGIRVWAATALGGLALGVAAYELTTSEAGDSSPPAPASAPNAGAVEARPSAFARDTVPERLLDLYLRTARRLGLDWSVIGAADQIEGAGSPASAAERASAIGYTLQSLGAPDDYRAALEARAPTRGYARDVLQLAERYRTVDSDQAPVARRPLELPVGGRVIAGFGQRLGVLHDGIDIDAPSGEPLRSSAPGLVVSTGFHRLFGETTCILHRFPRGLRGERELTTCYGNQSRYEVQPGDAVAAGDVIGRVGCTGACVRPHVHFQVRLGSGPTAPVTDPAPFLGRGAGAIGSARPLEAPPS